MPALFIRFSYEGTAYSGFQLQANAPTVQGALEKALGVIYKEAVRLAGAGRTDAGVHAREQTATFTAPFTIAPLVLPRALNALLPGDIVVFSAAEVDPAFHARFDARGKIYSYRLDCAPYPRVLQRLYSWHCPFVPDMGAMGRAAALFRGTHDFGAFQAAGSPVASTVRTLRRLEVSSEDGGQTIILIYEGDGFLYRMVRLITGTLVRAGRGLLQEEEISAALAGHNPPAVGPAAPPRGLCLEKVLYDSVPTL